jgi:hypothetical protein
MFHPRRWALSGAAAMLSVLTGLAMAGPVSAAAGWSVVGVRHTAINTEFNAMSARTSSDAWAVGTLNAVAARTASDVYAVGFHEPSVNGGVQQGMILRWNGSTWPAATDPTAGTSGPLYGATTLPGATTEWAAGINGSDQALVLSHG